MTLNNRINKFIKRFLSIITVITLFLPLSIHTAAFSKNISGFAGGSGSSSNPWVISSPEQLVMLNDYLNDNGIDRYFILGNDIDLSGYLTEDNAGYNNGEGWQKIGKYELHFNGTLDGNGHIISGLWMNQPDGKSIGLFSYIGAQGTVKNLGILLDDEKGINGYQHTGSLAGNNDGVIENCYAEGVVSADNGAGGLIGKNNGKIEDCYFKGTIKGTAGGLVQGNEGYIYNSCFEGKIISDKGHSTGGLACYNNGFVENCYTKGEIIGKDNVGGLLGSNNRSIKNCYSEMNVKGMNNVGGLIGIVYYSDDATILDNCYSIGNITGNTKVGGLIGSNNSIVINSFSGGIVTGEEDVGGLIGSGSNNIIINCNSTGDVYGINNVGGLFGNGSIDMMVNNYASGTVYGEKYIGGFIGKNTNDNALIKRNYSTGDVYGTNGVGGFIGSIPFNCVITYCYSTGNIYGDGEATYIGGFTGSNMGSVSFCYSTGDVKGVDYIGGFAGSNYGSDEMSGKISNCYSSGMVTGTNFIGGFIGANSRFNNEEKTDSIIKNCYSLGSVTGSGENTGIFAGENKYKIINCYAAGELKKPDYKSIFAVNCEIGTVENCFFDSDMLEQSNDKSGALGKTGIEMKKTDTYNEWDFENTWEIPNNDDYPKLLESKFNDKEIDLKNSIYFTGYTGEKLSDIVLPIGWTWEIPDTKLKKTDRQEFKAFIPTGENKDEFIEAIITVKGYIKLSTDNLEILVDDVTYDGSQKMPPVTVIYNGKILKDRGYDYYINYGVNIEPGTGNFSIDFQGDYSGKIDGTFKITENLLPKSVEIKDISLYIIICSAILFLLFSVITASMLIKRRRINKLYKKYGL